LASSAAEASGTGYSLKLSEEQQQIQVGVAFVTFTEILLDSTVTLASILALQKLARDFTKTEIIPKAAQHDKTMEFPAGIFKKGGQ
jgi:hypothetical protein